MKKSPCSSSKDAHTRKFGYWHRETNETKSYLDLKLRNEHGGMNGFRIKVEGQHFETVIKDEAAREKT